MAERICRPIHVSWTRGVRDWEAEAVIEGMRAVLKFAIAKPRIKVLGSAPWTDKDKDYSSADWYQNHNLINLPEIGEQVDAGSVLNDMAQRSFQRNGRYIDLMILDKDLNTRFLSSETREREWIGFAFGQAMQGVGTVISVWRFRNGIRDLAQCKKALRGTSAHESGHILGLVHRQNDTVDHRGGIYDAHCLNPCVMHQVINVEEELDLVLRLHERGIVLCEHCQEELASYGKRSA